MSQFFYCFYGPTGTTTQCQDAVSAHAKARSLLKDSSFRDATAPPTHWGQFVPMGIAARRDLDHVDDEGNHYYRYELEPVPAREQPPQRQWLEEECRRERTERQRLRRELDEMLAKQKQLAPVEGRTPVVPAGWLVRPDKDVWELLAVLPSKFVDTRFDTEIVALVASIKDGCLRSHTERADMAPLEAIEALAWAYRMERRPRHEGGRP